MPDGPEVHPEIPVSHVSRYHSVPMSPNRVFMSGALLDRWIAAGRVEFDGRELRVTDDAARFLVEEAAHVVAEVSGSGDTHGLLGAVQPLSVLAALGAEVLHRSMVIGELAYDVIPGYLLSPVGRPGGRVATAALLGLLTKLSEKQSDEELLARYLIERL